MLKPAIIKANPFLIGIDLSTTKDFSVEIIIGDNGKIVNRRIIT